MNAARMAPYAGIASSYDVALGRGSLNRTATTVGHVIQRYGIGFRSAADIGCGTGLFAAHLARRWRVPVFAVDRSVPMLREAFRNGSARHARMLWQDVRRLSLPRPVDLITANFDTVNHIVAPCEVAATFSRVHANLRPGGHFVFDFVTDSQPWRTTEVRVRPLPAAGCDLVQRILWNPVGRLIFVTVTRRSARLRVRTLERHVERAYAAVDVVHWLRRSGFFIRAVLDAATLEQAHGGSRRIVIVARRSDAVATTSRDAMVMSAGRK